MADCGYTDELRNGFKAFFPGLAIGALLLLVFGARRQATK